MSASSWCSDAESATHEGLGAAVDAVEQELRRQRDGRGDVDDRALAARDEAGHRGIGEPHQGGDVDVDHLLHQIDVGLPGRHGRADAGIVDEQRDAGVGPEDGLDPREVRHISEVGGDHLDRTSGAVGNSRRQCVEPSPLAGDKDEVIASRARRSA